MRSALTEAAEAMIKLRKKALRKPLLHMLRQQDPAARSSAAQQVAHIFENSFIMSSSSVLSSCSRLSSANKINLAAYIPMSYELDVLPIVDAAFKHGGFRILMPHILTTPPLSPSNTKNSTNLHAHISQQSTIDSRGLGEKQQDCQHTATAATNGHKQYQVGDDNKPTDYDEGVAEEAALAAGGDRMVFVECLSAHDLEVHFTPQPPYNIRGIEPAVFRQALLERKRRRKRTDLMQQEAGGVSVGVGSCISRIANSSGDKRSGEVERLIITASDGLNAALGHHKTTSVQATTEEASTIDVVLYPGLAFDVRNGARLGKGGGFYDQFFRPMRQFQQQLQQHSIDARTHRKNTENNDSAVHQVMAPIFIGVGFDGQMISDDSAETNINLKSQIGSPTVDTTTATGAAASEVEVGGSSSLIPMEDHDIPVDWILSPSLGLRRCSSHPCQ